MLYTSLQKGLNAILLCVYKQVWVPKNTTNTHQYIIKR